MREWKMVDFNFDNLKVDNTTGRVTVGGVSSGIDVQAAVDGIITARRIPIDRIQQRIDTNNERIDALGRLRSFTETLQSSLTDLRGAVVSQSSDIFESRETYLSNFRTDGRAASPPTSLLNVNVSGDAPLGENEIEIRQVARSNKIASRSFNDRDQALGLSGSIRLSGIMSGSPSPPIIIDANDSLIDIRDQINAANSGTNATGVAASIIQISATENVLVLSAQEPARDIVISGDTALVGAAGLGLVTPASQAAALSVPAQAVIGPGAGIATIDFDGSQGTDAFALSYEAATTSLTLTRIYDGVSETVNIGAVGTGPFAFAPFGAAVTLNAGFNRAVDITPANGVFSNPANSGDITPASIVIDSAFGNVSGFDFSNLSFDVTNPANITLTSGTFSGTFDGSTLGGKVVNLDDGAGNQVTINLDVATAFDTQGTPFIALGNHTFTQAGNSGQIDAGSLSVSTMSGTVGPLNHADLSFDVTDPAAIIVSFGGFQGTFDGTTTGAKTLTLASGADTLTLDFTVSTAFDDQGNPEISLNDHTYNAGAGSGDIRDDATLRLLYTQGDISGVATKQLSFDSTIPSRVEMRLGDFVGTFDGTQTGTKEVTLSDDNGNALAIQFIVDTAFDSLGAPSLQLDFLDTVVTSAVPDFANQIQASQNARLAVEGLTDPTRYESDLVPDKTLHLKNYLNLAPDTGAFSIAVGATSVTVNYDVDDADADPTTPNLPLTLERLATHINNTIAAAPAAVNARARIVDYTNGSRLVIESTSVPPQEVTLTDTNFLLFDLGVDDEVVIERPSNTIDDLFSGLTLELLNAEEGTTIRLETQRNNVKVKEGIMAFVEAYNAFKQFANQQAELDPETGLSNGAPLFGNTALRQIETIANTIIGTGASNQDPQMTIQVLAQIGVTFVDNTSVQSDLRDTLRVDEAALNDALLNDFDSVRRLFGFDFTSSDNRVSFLGLNDAPAYSQTGYTLNLSYAGGAVSSATIQVTGSPAIVPVSVSGNILRVEEGPAAGLRLFYSGDGTAPPSVDVNFTTGFAQQLFAQLQNALDPVSGSIANSVESLEGRNTLSEQRIERIRYRTDLERERLLQRFTRMEESLARAAAVRESLTQLFETLRPERDR